MLGIIRFNICHQILDIIIFCLLPVFCFSQCANNLLINGSFNGEPDNSAVAEGWTTDLFPDINDAGGELFTASTSYNWIGTILSSNDGGSWINLIGPENVYQYVDLIVGVNYELCFEYAAQGIFAEGPIDTFIFDQPVGLKVILNDQVTYYFDPDTTQYTWEQECMTFTAGQVVNKIEFGATELQYLGVDGACLIPEEITSVSSYKKKEEFLIYPNVLNGQNNFRINSFNEDSFSLDIYSSTGIGIYQNKYVKDGENIELNNDLPKGIYYLLINKNQPNTYRTKVIIQ